MTATAESAIAPVARGVFASLPGPLAGPVLTIAGHHVVATRTSAARDVCTLNVEDDETLQVVTLTPTLDLRSISLRVERGAQLAFVATTTARGTDRASKPSRADSARFPCRGARRSRPTRRDYWLRKDAP